jgi:DNA-directed RNA polymerase subunit RPC12/RpoP
MLLRCRQCGKDADVTDGAPEWTCEFCGARFVVKMARVVERERVRSESDPLDDFR